MNETINASYLVHTIGDMTDDLVPVYVVIDGKRVPVIAAEEKDCGRALVLRVKK
jgi:hypothetical protein